ncbi:NUDIX domain-containing protein [Streptomyces sp. DSM 15324]|uniref:NUDIX domain-containing protein n=1 Tax=Streptomyces sp. DSM 15324 TaxID=1739111 RepID=UPI00074802CB|nr:NUDIX domain-containing protein [Streptomyces sp. DSM 15324]KUO09978.1 NUDIX hydrolase [Streptomyces sp. DSM 15324]
MSDVHRSIPHVVALLQHPSDGRVLTVRHQPHSWHSPGLLTVVGGRLEVDEFFDEGAAREFTEETGILIAPDRLEFCRLVHLHAAHGERVTGVVFLTRQWEGEPFNREPGTHSELVWADPADPPGDCHPFTRELLRHFDAGLRYANVVAPELSGGGECP